MEHFEEYALDREGSLAVTAEPPEWLDTDRPEHEEVVTEPASSDDPVRVYLREMGSVRLLTRQAEIDLARRMERGNLRFRKALSRSPLVWRSALALYEDVRTGEGRIEDCVELSGPDDGVITVDSLSRFIGPSGETLVMMIVMGQQQAVLDH